MHKINIVATWKIIVSKCGTQHIQTVASNIRKEKMKHFLFILFLLYSSIGFSQKTENKLLIDVLSNIKNSEKIHDYIKSKKVTVTNELIFKLSNEFIQKSKTEIFSKCHNRYLSKGEVAIIIVEQNLHKQKKTMPYFQLTGIQNCLMTFCKDNPNFIEYYFPYIENITEFQTKFRKWYQDLLNKELVDNNSLRKIKRMLSDKTWGILTNDDNITYSFYFNKLSLRKGVFITYDQKTNKKLNEIHFKLVKMNNKLNIYFGNTNKGKTLNKLNKVELVISGKKYNFVRYCW